MMEPFTPKNIGLYTTQISNSADASTAIQLTLDKFVQQKLDELKEEIKELKKQIKDLNEKNINEQFLREFLKEHLSIQGEYDSWMRTIKVRLCLDDETISVGNVSLGFFR